MARSIGEREGFVEADTGKARRMLRKLLWTAIFGVFGAVATIAARTAASRVYRILTGEPPPVKK
jgi:hypothetical protein